MKKFSKLNKNYKLPEDMIFSRFMKHFNKNLPSILESCKFSLENVHVTDEKYFGGHQFWFCLPDWEKVIEQNIINTINTYSNS